MSFLNGSIENYCSATGSQKEYIGRTTASFSSKDKQENVMYKVFKSMIQNLWKYSLQLQTLTNKHVQQLFTTHPKVKNYLH